MGLEATKPITALARRPWTLHRSGLAINLLLHRPIERLPRCTGTAVSGATRPVGVGGDHQLALGVDKNALADAGARVGGLRQPAVRHDALPVDCSTVEDELSKTRKIPRHRLDASTADLLAGFAQNPARLLLHACGNPDLLGQVVCQRFFGGLGEQNAHQVSLAGTVTLS